MVAGFFPNTRDSVVLDCCLHDQGTKIDLDVAVVMPDHVHFIGTPFPDVSLAKITKGIKGTSGRNINKLLGREGVVWQDEPFDHQIRHDESLVEKIEYVC